MHQTVSSLVSAPPARVAEIVSDLGTYPHWLALVTEATPTADDDPAWLVTIRATVGPFARSKKLRMVRTVAQEPGSDGVDATYRFERRELDGRSHSAWTLDATVAPAGGDQTNVTMDLRYDGRLWTAPLEPILGSFIDGAGPDLEAYANRG